MYTRPIFTIAAFLFRPFARFLGMQVNFMPIYNLLWSSTSGLVSLIGTRHTLGLLYRLGRGIRSGSIDANIIVPRNNRIATIINDRFLNLISPHIPIIINNRFLVTKIIYFIMMTVLMLIVRPIVNLVLRTLFSVLFSSTCILFH